MVVSDKVSSKSRIAGYDLIKSIAAFMVCFYHLGTLDFGFSPEKIYYPNLNKILLGLCAAGVPLFFILNGALLIPKEYSLKEGVFKVLNTIKVYIFWMLFIGSVFVVSTGAKINSLWQFFSEIRSLTVYLWFFQTLAILYIFNLVFIRIKKHS